MELVHILIPKGHYIGQVREAGHRLWTQTTAECKTAEEALSLLAVHMPGMKRGRVLFIDQSGYYEPHIVMEVNRT